MPGRDSSCKTEKHYWSENRGRGPYDCADVWDRARERTRRELGRRHLKARYDSASRIVETIAGRKRPQSEAARVELIFNQNVARWKSETLHWSSIQKMISHPSYLRIIGIGKPVIPLLIRELHNNPDHWFAALEAVTGENPVPPTANFPQAVAAWVEWWERNNDSRRVTGTLS